MFLFTFANLSSLPGLHLRARPPRPARRLRGHLRRHPRPRLLLHPPAGLRPALLALRHAGRGRVRRAGAGAGVLPPGVPGVAGEEGQAARGGGEPQEVSGH